MISGSNLPPSWHHDLLTSGQRQRLRPTQMYPSEIMTIVMLFHQSHYRTFKAYYIEHVHCHLRSEFPTLASYSRFVELMPTVLVPLVGWFYGFKLHLVVNDQGELLAFCLTPGNVDDRHPVPKLATGLVGKLFGDKGYLSQPLAQQLLVTHGLHLITKLRKKMHNRLLQWSDRLLLRKRAIIETINDQLKNICQIEHSRHRSPINFLVNLVAGLIAYCHQPKKPSLGLRLPTVMEA